MLFRVHCGITHSTIFFVKTPWTAKNKSKQFSWIPPQVELKFNLCDKKSLVISDLTATCLPISGPPTCQERPKYSVLLMKRICSSRSPGLLTSGLISSLRLLVFQATIEKHTLVFLKALLSPGLVVSLVSSPSPQISLESEICPRYCFT